MTLGTKISALRNQHSLSQGELAEMVNVSRQSISKWETDTSVPELDKLIRLSEIFEITLDELVKDGNPAQKTDAPQERVQVVIQKPAAIKTVVGIILLCFGILIWLLLTILGGFLSGLLFAAPFLLCGTVCMITKKNTGLWCCWALFFAVNVYLRFATGITWRLTLFTLNYDPRWNYLRLAFAWLELICFLALVGITVLRLSKNELVLSAAGRIVYIAGWVVFSLLFIPLSTDPLSGLSNIVFIFSDWVKVGIFTALLTTTLRLRRIHKAVHSKNP